MKKLFFVLLVALPMCTFGMEYTVEIRGVSNNKMRSSIEESCTLYTLRTKKPISSYLALRKRAEADVPKLKAIADSFGYFSSVIDFTIVRAKTAQVILRFDLGPQYTVSKVIISPAPEFDRSQEIINKPVLSEEIFQFEESILLGYKNLGYAFCKIAQRDLLADRKTHTVTLQLKIELGPKIYFGKTTVHGRSDVKSQVFFMHLPWKEGDVYSKEKVDLAHQSLEKTGLFSSIIIEDSPDKVQDGALPIDIYLTEAKHKSISSGVSYTSYKGPGVFLGWEHRNVGGLGNKFTSSAELWMRQQDIKATLREPHYKQFNQDRVWQAEFLRQDILAYFSESSSLSLAFERKWDAHWEGSGGGKVEYLSSNSDEGHAQYYLCKLPLVLKWIHTDVPTDPRVGYTAQIKLTPAYQLHGKQFSYCIHTTTVANYLPLWQDHITLATKAVLGNIIGASQYTIPKPDRFFSGSENTLRGYKYFSVSPLDSNNQPIGGRSMAALSVEARIRTNSPFGCVFFYDVGNVFSKNIPSIKPLLQSVGFGIRYATPIGPLRLDFAVPLHRRRAIDPPFQIYCSIGHAF